MRKRKARKMADRAKDVKGGCAWLWKRVFEVYRRERRMRKAI